MKVWKTSGYYGCVRKDNTSIGMLIKLRNDDQKKMHTNFTNVAKIAQPAKTAQPAKLIIF